MANDYLEFATTINGLTDEETDWWRNAADELPLIAESKSSNGFICEVINPDPARSAACPYVYLACADDGWGDLELLAEVVQQFLRKFKPDKYFWTGYCYRCDKYRPDNFGGGIIFVTADKIVVESPSMRANDLRAEHLGLPANKQ